MDDRDELMHEASTLYYLQDETMDAIDAFKVEALGNMAQTIGVLESEVTKSRSYLERVAKTDQRNRSGSLDIGGGQRL